MNAQIVLFDPKSGHEEISTSERLVSAEQISYTDAMGVVSLIDVFDDGITIERKALDHVLKMCLREEKYVEIGTEEGILRFDAKVIDFERNNDILVMHYIVNDEERVLKVIYY